MGSQVKISAEEQENSFYVYDCTGTDNKTGYGIPGFKTDDIIKSTLFVQGPSDTTDYPWEIDVTGSLPNTKGIAYEVLPIQIGQTNEIESGKYKLKLVHKFKNKYGKTVERTGYGVKVFYNNIACCIDSKMPNVDHNAPNDPTQKLTTELNLMLEGVKIQAKKGLYDKANQTIDYMKQQCKCSGC